MCVIVCARFIFGIAVATHFLMVNEDLVDCCLDSKLRPTIQMLGLAASFVLYIEFVQADVVGSLSRKEGGKKVVSHFLVIAASCA